MFFPSAEFRWFFPGAPSRDLLDWFVQSFTESSLATRTDLYLLGLDARVNVKLREGKVEVKQRLRRRPDVLIKGAHRGALEEWTKWSYPVAPGQDVVAEAGKHPAYWLPVQKERRLRTFILEGEEVTETAPGSFPEKGCQAELTTLRAGGRDHHSLGFEAFGHSQDLPGLLRSVAVFFLNHDFPAYLRHEASMGYPAWLIRHFPSPAKAGE